jgi:hypothetical protein
VSLINIEKLKDLPYTIHAPRTAEGLSPCILYLIPLHL